MAVDMTDNVDLKYHAEVPYVRLISRPVLMKQPPSDASLHLLFIFIDHLFDKFRTLLLIKQRQRLRPREASFRLNEEFPIKTYIYNVYIFISSED